MHMHWSTLPVSFFKTIRYIIRLFLNWLKHLMRFILCLWLFSIPVRKIVVENFQQQKGVRRSFTEVAIMVPTREHQSSVQVQGRKLILLQHVLDQLDFLASLGHTSWQCYQCNHMILRKLPLTPERLYPMECTPETVNAINTTCTDFVSIKDNILGITALQHFEVLMLMFTYPSNVSVHWTHVTK